MDDKKSYYAIIPATVRYDKHIPANAKLLYGEITALCNQNGLCWASNSYFAELYEVNETTIKRWISTLAGAGYIHRSIQYEEDGKTVIRRCLSISDAPTPVQKCTEGRGKNAPTPGGKNEPYNNTDINTTFNNTSSNPRCARNRVLKDMVGNSPLSGKLKDGLLKWLEYKRYKYEEISVKTLLEIVDKKATEFGEQAVIDLIDECISNRWQGIIWDKLEKRKVKTSVRGEGALEQAKRMIKKFEEEGDGGNDGLFKG